MRKLHLYAFAKLMLAHRKVPGPPKISSVVSHDTYMTSARESLRIKRELDLIGYELAEMRALLDGAAGALNQHELVALRKTLSALEKKREEKEKKLAKDLKGPLP